MSTSLGERSLQWIHWPQSTARLTRKGSRSTYNKETVQTKGCFLLIAASTFVSESLESLDQILLVQPNFTRNHQNYTLHQTRSNVPHFQSSYYDYPAHTASLESYSNSKAQIFLIFMLKVTKVSPIPLGSLLHQPSHGRDGTRCGVAIRALLPVLPKAFATSSLLRRLLFVQYNCAPGGSRRLAESQRAGITLSRWPLRLGASRLYRALRA